MNEEACKPIEGNWDRFIQRLYDELELREYCWELISQYNRVIGQY